MTLETQPASSKGSTPSQAGKKTKPPQKFSKKTLEYFKNYFLRISGRKLPVLYPIFAQDDFYIVSNVTPHYLMSGESEGAYLFLDLSKEDPEIRDDIREMVSYLLPDKVCAIRMDYLTSLIERYNDGKPPAPVCGVNPDGENIHIFMSDPSVKITPEKMQELVKDPELKDARKRYIVKLSWDIDEGFFYTPLCILRDLYKDLIADVRADRNLFGRLESEEPQTELTVGQYIYRIRPTIGVDTLNLAKFKNVRVDSYLTKSLSNRALLMGHYAMIGEPGKILEALILRPDALLFPKRSS